MEHDTVHYPAWKRTVVIADAVAKMRVRDKRQIFITMRQTPGSQPQQPSAKIRHHVRRVRSLSRANGRQRSIVAIATALSMHITAAL